MKRSLARGPRFSWGNCDESSICEYGFYVSCWLLTCHCCLHRLVWRAWRPCPSMHRPWLLPSRSIPTLSNSRPWVVTWFACVFPSRHFNRPSFVGRSKSTSFEIDSPLQTLRVLDFWPKSEVYSDIEGTVSVQRTQ